MTGETDTEIPDTGAVFTFGKSKIANNVPSRLWLKNDIPVHISCGQSHSAFVTEQGRLFVFGSNNSGQLGLQTKGPVTKPICVKVLKGERVQFVACGTDHTLVSTSQGEFFAAGGNSDGQLGLGHCNDSISFQRLHPFCDYAPIKLLSAGDHTSAALTEDGRLFLWGDNSVGQLGLGNDSHALLPEELKLGQLIQWVSCGYRHSALVTDNGDVFTFGESADGRLGLSAHQLANHSCPQRVESLHGVLQVACGGKHTLALTEDELYSFGRGEFGQLGLGTQMFVTDVPVAVGHFRKGRVTHVTCGENHSALITDSGLLYTFGDGRHGKLGLGDENFTNQFSPTVCQRFFDYSVMTVACGSSHMLVFARPRQQDSEEVCLEDEDVTYSYLDRCYTSMLQGQPLEHIPEPAPALLSQLIFLPSSLPTSHRWSLSTRARRRQRESSSAQFGPEFCDLPPPTTGFTALALRGNILQPRSPTDTPKRFKTEAPVESPSTSITLPVGTPPLTPITKSAEDCHSVGTSENSMSDKTHEQHKNKMARASSIGKEENVPQQAPPTEVQSGSVSHPSMTESLPPSSLKHKKPRSGNPKNPATQEKCFSTTASQSKIQSKTYKKPIQSTNNKSKVQAVEVRLSPERMSAKEREGCSETRSTNTDSRHKISKADKNSKVQQAVPGGQEVTTLAQMEQETKSGSLKIQNTSSPDQEVKQVRKTPTKIQEGIPVRVTKRVKSSVKVQDVPSGRMEVSVVESTLQTDPAQKDIKLSIGKAQEVRSTLIDTQEQENPTSEKISAKIQNSPEKGNEKIQVDAEENPGDLTPKKAKKKRSDVQRAPMEETTPKTPSPPSVSIPTRMSKAKKRKPVEVENSNVQLRTKMLAQVKRENDSKTPQNSNIFFPPIENRKSEGAAEISQSTSNLQSEHKNSQSPTDKALTEQKYEFPSIKSLTPERGHSFSSLWSNNKSATSKSSATKETESSSGNLLSPSRQHRRSPLNEIKLDAKSVEPEEPDRKPQAEQSIMGSVVSSLPAMAIASAAPLLIKATEVLSETSPEQSNDMSLCASVSQEIAGNNILPEQEVDQDSTVQDVSAVEEIDDSSTKKQSAQDVQNKLVLDENGKMVEEEDVRDSETEREEERGEEESLVEEENESEGVGQKEEGSAVEDEESESDNDEESDSAQKGEVDGEEEEGEEEESEVAGEEEDDSDSRQSSKSEGEGRGDETEREEEESEGQVKEEGEDGEMEEEENKDEESGGEDEEEENESWDERSEGEVEDEEKTDAEEEQEGESSNEEKMEVGEQSDSEDENKNVRLDEEEGESEEKDGSEEEEEEENKTGEGEGEQEEKEDEESEEEDKVGNEDEEENQDEETDHEEEEGNRDQEEEEEENDEEGEEDKEEEVDEEENNEELKYKKDGVTNSEEEEGEESVRENEEQQDEVEVEDEEKISETDADEDRERQEGSEQIEEEDEEKEEGEKEGEMDTSEVKFREEENLDISETREEDRGDEDDEVNKPNEIMEENNEEESGSEKEEEETDKKRENKKTDRGGGKQTETNEEEEEDGEEEEEEAEQKEMKQRETSEEEEQEEESEEEEEEEEAEQKEIKRSETSEEEEQEEESEEEEQEAEQEEMKQRETSEEEEQEEESEEEEEEQEAEQKEMKQRETSEEEEQEEESEEEEEEQEAEQKEMKQRETSEEEEQEEESEEEEEEEEEQKAEQKGMKQRETSEEEEQEEESEEEEEEEEEEAEQKEMNIKEKNRMKQRETSEEEEQEEEGDEEEEEEEEEETEKKDKIGRKQTETTEEEEEGEEEGEEEEEEGEEEKTKKVPKQRAKPNVLPARRQTNAQRDRQKTRQRDQQNVKGKKQADSGAQDPQFWNSVLPQYLNLK
ncbi:trichohyalin [Megalobrama amblycephala]|uniref:trichohyalin n=1 Tax=Megalobrama amblycephala TaxID=75352 RepID=UPI002013DD17|nr:trichohyalin [Megalobrama amblycephala]